MSTINHLHNEEIAQEIGVFVVLEYYYTSWSLRNFNLMTKILKMETDVIISAKNKQISNVL